MWNNWNEVLQHLRDLVSGKHFFFFKGTTDTQQIYKQLIHNSFSLSYKLG